MINKITTIAAIAAIIFFIQINITAQVKEDSMTPQQDTEVTLKPVTIHQEVDFNVSPERIYNALLDTKQFCEFTAQSGMFSANSAKIDPSEGGAFSLFDGHITGRNVELAPNKRIVQAWRSGDWPEGVYSIARFELKAQGSGTHLVFDHTGFPVNMRDHLAAGWTEHYWEPLKKYLH
jgi:activator of HSP90 ATPase